ncbi:MAG: alpha/beta hydrolase [Magnetococcales bacterium]|nr:alpha/beta hydrolase [Magnetococcales bacterium]
MLVLVHGWGLGPGLWHAVRRALPDWPCHTLDLGFFGRARLEVPTGQPLLAVGHSLGFLWLLHHLAQSPWSADCVGLVSIGGFARFGRAADFPHGIAPRLLARMRQRLPQDATGVLRDFCRQGGGLASPDPVVTDTVPLVQGLHWLENWDGRAALAAWAGPVYCLAAQDDAIVPPALTEACFAAERVHWLATGGHLLPLTRPVECGAFLLNILGGGEPPPKPPTLFF